MMNVFERLRLYNLPELKRKRLFKHQRRKSSAGFVVRDGLKHTSERVMEFAREHRSSQTYCERKFRRILKACRLSGKFKSQFALYGFIVDFYFPLLQLGIEIDGSSHIGREGYDIHRENILNGHGIRLVRFTNEEVKKDAHLVAKRLVREIKVSRKIMKLKNRKDRPRATTGKVYFSGDYNQEQLAALIPRG
jgi:very-short-patch-repair endonuclease